MYIIAIITLFAILFLRNDFNAASWLFVTSTYKEPHFNGNDDRFLYYNVTAVRFKSVCFFPLKCIIVLSGIGYCAIAHNNYNLSLQQIAKTGVGTSLLDSWGWPIETYSVMYIFCKCFQMCYFIVLITSSDLGSFFNMLFRKMVFLWATYKTRLYQTFIFENYSHITWLIRWANLALEFCISNARLELWILKTSFH